MPLAALASLYAAASLSLSMPTSASTGLPLAVTVTALNASGTTDLTYRGLIQFTSGDTQLRAPSSYAFSSADQGVHTFNCMNFDCSPIEFRTQGTQVLTVTDGTLSSSSGAVNVSPSHPACVAGARDHGSPWAIADLRTKAAQTNPPAGSFAELAQLIKGVADNTISSGTRPFSLSTPQGTRGIFRPGDGPSYGDVLSLFAAGYLIVGPKSGTSEGNPQVRSDESKYVQAAMQWVTDLQGKCSWQYLEADRDTTCAVAVTPGNGGAACTSDADPACSNGQLCCPGGDCSSTSSSSLICTNYAYDSSQFDLTYGAILRGMSLLYDWAYDGLTSADRTYLEQAIKNRGTSFYTNGVLDSHSPEFWTTTLMQNHNWIGYATLEYAACAMQAVDPLDAKAWSTTARADLQLVKSNLDLIADGTWHEAPGYQGFAMGILAPALLMLDNQWDRPAGTTYNFFSPALNDLAYNQQTDYFSAYRRLVQADMLAEAPRQQVVAAGDFYGWDQTIPALLRGVAQRWNTKQSGQSQGAPFDGQAQWLADRWRLSVSGWYRYAHNADSSQWPQILELLLWNDSITSTSTNLGQSGLLGDAMIAVLGDGGANHTPTFKTLQVGLKAGAFGGVANQQRICHGVNSGQPNPLPSPPGSTCSSCDYEQSYSHDHADDNGLYVTYGGEYLMPEAEGYYIGQSIGDPAASITAYHNSLLIDGAGQFGSANYVPNMSSIPEGFRGSNATIYPSSSNSRTTPFPWFCMRSASIPDFTPGTYASYTRGDGKNLYGTCNGAGICTPSLGRFDRAVYLSAPAGRGRYVLVRDDIAAADTSSHVFTDVWHFETAPTISGGWIRGQTANVGTGLGIFVASPPSASAVVQPSQAPRNTSKFIPQPAQPINSFGRIDVSTGSTAKATILNVLVPLPEVGGLWASLPRVSTYPDATWTPAYDQSGYIQVNGAFEGPDNALQQNETEIWLFNDLQGNVNRTSGPSGATVSVNGAFGLVGLTSGTFNTSSITVNTSPVATESRTYSTGGQVSRVEVFGALTTSGVPALSIAYNGVVQVETQRCSSSCADAKAIAVVWDSTNSAITVKWSTWSKELVPGPFRIHAHGMTVTACNAGGNPLGFSQTADGYVTCPTN